ncbi:hypothetical protein N8I84_25440 [Streptomyces cynarae]|uniref:Lipoprotein n=1 Tax=Streptomyces cynarae TaxID=2981134 RepID=A0ABY6E6X2_9ACTN|nr:hypothetical protein [Streptomyces cynarae]UXY21668.1 hypothetical protein N8I84_25440 [Streptomyces cynarae]
MDFRHTLKGRRALSAVAVATGLLLTVAGCGGGGDDTSDKGTTTASAPARSSSNGHQEQSQAPQSEAALAEVKGENGLTLTVTSAKRDNGGFVTVEGTVTNNTGSPWVGGTWRGDEQELAKNGGSIAGASLIDQKGKKRYLILRDTSGRCLCTQFSGGVKNGETVQWFAQFPAPPQGTDKVDFQVGSMPPASIDISEG